MKAASGKREKKRRMIESILAELPADAGGNRHQRARIVNGQSMKDPPLCVKHQPSRKPEIETSAGIARAQIPAVPKHSRAARLKQRTLGRGPCKFKVSPQPAEAGKQIRTETATDWKAKRRIESRTEIGRASCRERV